MTKASLELSADTPSGWRAMWPYIEWLLGRQGLSMPKPVTLGRKFVVWRGDEEILDRARELLGFYRVPVRAKLKSDER